MQDVPKLFMELTKEYSYQNGFNAPRVPLSNFTFWVGAGFSKAWNPSYPTNEQLFNIKNGLEFAEIDTNAIYRIFDVGGNGDFSISMNQLKDCVFRLNMYEKYPAIRPRFIDPQNICRLKANLVSIVAESFNANGNLNYFDESIQKFPLCDPTENQNEILRFFSYLRDRIDGSQPLLEGIQTHFVTTNYDYTIETIIDNSLGPDDSIFLYTYRGITPDRVVQSRNPQPVLSLDFGSHLIKINGGFEICRTNDNYTLDYSHRSQPQILENPPLLILPSRDQDYQDEYFRQIFPKVVRLLRETTVLILVGYSFPHDDAILRFLLRQFAEEPEDSHRKVLFYIDPNPKTSLVSGIFSSSATAPYSSPSVYSFKGGFEEFASECNKRTDST